MEYVRTIETLDNVVALAVMGAWLTTAVLGAILILRGGAYRLLLSVGRGDRRYPLRRAAIMSTHICLAGTGASLWALSIVTGRLLFFYGACAVLIPTALSGLTVFSRWLPSAGRHALPRTDGRPVPGSVAAAHFVGAVLTILWALTSLALVLDGRY